MTLIVFRLLPDVAAVEEQLRLQSRGLLPDAEAEELPHLIDDASRELFGISANDTLYPALPEAVRARTAEANGKPSSDCSPGTPGIPTNIGAASASTSVVREGRSLHCLECSGASWSVRSIAFTQWQSDVRPQRDCPRGLTRFTIGCPTAHHL